jgi:hypothetical protein
MADDRPIAVLGFRPHTYWTAAVALAGPVEAPQVLERRKLTFASGDEKFVYHQAETQTLEAAAANIDQVRGAVTGHVAQAVGELIAELESGGFRVSSAVAPKGAAKVPADLAGIIASHAAMHAAEGHFYRDAVVLGCEALGLSTHRILEKALKKTVAERLEADEAAVDEALKTMGATLGPPWSEDFKLATLAAWTRL